MRVRVPRTTAQRVDLFSLVAKCTFSSAASRWACSSTRALVGGVAFRRDDGEIMTRPASTTKSFCCSVFYTYTTPAHSKANTRHKIRDLRHEHTAAQHCAPLRTITPPQDPAHSSHQTQHDRHNRPNQPPKSQQPKQNPYSLWLKKHVAGSVRKCIRCRNATRLSNLCISVDIATLGRLCLRLILTLLSSWWLHASCLTQQRLPDRVFNTCEQIDGLASLVHARLRCLTRRAPLSDKLDTLSLSEAQRPSSQELHGSNEHPISLSGVENQKLVVVVEWLIRRQTH